MHLVGLQDWGQFAGYCDEQLCCNVVVDVNACGVELAKRRYA